MGSHLRPVKVFFLCDGLSRDIRYKASGERHRDTPTPPIPVGNIGDELLISVRGDLMDTFGKYTHHVF